jgi:glutamate racemase
VLIDSAQATARALQQALKNQGLLSPAQIGSERFLVTDNVERFCQSGSAFLGRVPDPVELVDLDAPTAPFAELST